MADSVKYVTLTDATFDEEVLQSEVPVLVDFWAAWCGPCRVIAPTIEKLAADFHGRVKVGKLDVDNNPNVATRYDIRSIPNLLFFKDGRVVDQVIGIMPERRLAEKLEDLVGQSV